MENLLIGLIDLLDEKGGTFGQFILTVLEKHGGKITVLNLFVLLPASAWAMDEFATAWILTLPTVFQTAIGITVVVIPAVVIVGILWMSVFLDD